VIWWHIEKLTPTLLLGARISPLLSRKCIGNLIERGSHPVCGDLRDHGVPPVAARNSVAYRTATSRFSCARQSVNSGLLIASATRERAN